MRHGLSAQRTKRVLGTASASVAVAAGLAVAPSAALAGGFRGAAMGNTAVISGQVGGSPIIGGAFLGNAVIRSHPFQRSFFPRSWIPYGVPLVYVPPPDYFAPAYSPPAYYDPLQGSSAVVSVATPPPPPAPPQREEVQYSDGRYELRGDGVATPYRWVWIPNPPPPPTSTRDSHLYGWIDADGVLHVTDRWDAVPPQYRSQAKLNQSS